MCTTKKNALFIGHTYHQKTKSSLFLLEILEERYDVRMVYIDPQSSTTYNEMSLVGEPRHYDLLVVWQVMPDIGLMKKFVSWDYGCFFPMYDHQMGNKEFYNETWQGFMDFNIVCFSKALFNDVVKAGFNAKYIQFFPKPHPVEEWGDEHGVFFWQRVTSLNMETLVSVTKHLDIHSVHLHEALDPGHKLLPPEKWSKELSSFIRSVEVRESEWFENKAQLTNEMDRYAFYMAPRYYEGIGMSFLDAMARGRCVIAPDTATMNEYITHGVNGLLYSWDGATDDCKLILPPDLPIRQLQANALHSIQEGYKRWEENKHQILEWCAEKAKPNRRQLCKSAVRYGWKDWPLEEQPWPEKEVLDAITVTKLPESSSTLLPIISVITVTYNLVSSGRKQIFMKCLDSVQAQQGVQIEHIIIDGGSSDTTLQLIKEYHNKNYPIKYISLNDDGIYEAMNRGLVIAKGEYVIFLNSDDYYHHPQGLQVSLCTLKKTQCDFSFASIKGIGGYSLHEDVLDYLSDVFIRAIFSHQSLLVSKRLMVEMHGYDLSYRSAADYDFVLRMILSGRKGCYVDLPFVSYSINGLSSTNLKQSRLETALVYKRLFKAYEDVQLSYDDAYFIPVNGMLPIQHPDLVQKLQPIAKDWYVLPEYSFLYKLYIPELIYAFKCILKGRWRRLYHFLLIHFNSRFNRKWYLCYHKDVAQAHLAPAAHYLDIGWRKGYNPSMLFSTQKYMSNHHEVENMNLCPLVHWKLIGKKQL